MSTGGAAHWSLMGRCGPMEELRAQIAQFAPSDVRVHVYGETGTGKEKVARALHRLSGRAGRSCVAVNIAAVPDAISPRRRSHLRNARPATRSNNARCGRPSS